MRVHILPIVVFPMPVCFLIVLDETATVQLHRTRCLTSLKGKGPWDLVLCQCSVVTGSWHSFENLPSSLTLLLPPFAIQHCTPSLHLCSSWIFSGPQALVCSWAACSSFRKELLSSFLRLQKVVYLTAIHYWIALEKLCQNLLVHLWINNSLHPHPVIT